jgi:hypothetical protein
MTDGLNKGTTKGKQEVYNPTHWESTIFGQVSKMPKHETDKQDNPETNGAFKAQTPVIDSDASCHVPVGLLKKLFF